jgi:hypothetical protein
LVDLSAVLAGPFDHPRRYRSPPYALFLTARTLLTFAIIKLFCGNRVVEVRVYQQFELTPDLRQRPGPSNQPAAAERTVHHFEAIRIAPPGTIPIELEIGARLGNVFGNLTQILDDSGVDDPSAAHSTCAM